MTRHHEVAREDALLFLAACFSNTKHGGYYSDAATQGLGASFLHDYALINYRRLYALALVAGINTHHQALILGNLLAAGAPDDHVERALEGALIAWALDHMPAPQAYRALEAIAARGVNNRRTRATIARFLRTRPDPVFHAVKYRRAWRRLARHIRLRMQPVELHRFLFGAVTEGAPFKTPLLETYRQAHYSVQAAMSLPASVAQGFAARHQVSAKRFWDMAQAQLTARERFRAQHAAARAGVKLNVDLARADVTRLASYLVNLSHEDRSAREAELAQALASSASRQLARWTRSGEHAALPAHIAVVCDRSRSSRGVPQRPGHPLAIALAISALMRAAAPRCDVIWTRHTGRDVLVTPRGQTDLATPLLRALASGATLILIVSDGFENDPHGAAHEVARLFWRDLDPHGRVRIVHVNPTFDGVALAPPALGPLIPTVGLNKAEDLPIALALADASRGDAVCGWTALNAMLNARATAALAPQEAS